MIDIKKKIKTPEYQEALKEMDLSEEDVIDSYQYNPKFTSNTADKILTLQSIAENYEATLRGKEEVTQDKGKIIYVQTSKALAGEEFIKLTGAILRSFANESNLVGNKNFDFFAIQAIDAFKKVCGMALRNMSIREESTRPILKIFKDRLVNIGCIITNNGKDNMKAIIGNMDRVEPQLPKGAF